MVERSTVIWTSTTYMVVYCCTIWFAAWATESFGLRPVCLIASGMCALGAGTKLISIHTRTFWQYELGQIMCAFAETFIVSLPARVAAVWFPSDEISTATSIGVFGNQLGVALSFKVPTSIVTGAANLTSDGEYYSEEDELFQVIKKQLIYEHSGLTIIGAFVFGMVVLFFKNEPKYPPSVSRARVLNVNDTTRVSPIETAKSFKRLISSRNFVLLCAGYGLLVGVYYALSGNIKSIIEVNLPADMDSVYKSQKIGDMGLIMIVAGVVASLFAGCILDAVKKFKAVSCIAYAVTLIMFLTWTFILQQQMIILDFIIAALLGCFMTGYLPIGFEFASEISWPESEATSSGFLNLAAMLVGAFLTPITEKIIGDDPKPSSVQTANLVLCGILFFGLILTLFIKEENRRQQADVERPHTGLDRGKSRKTCDNYDEKVIEAH